MNSNRKAIWYGVVGGAAALVLAAVHLADRRGPVGASAVNQFAHVAVAWFTFYALWLTFRKEGGAGRAPWAFLAAGVGVLAVGETGSFYIKYLLDIVWRELWWVNFVTLAAFGCIVVALVVKGSSFGKGVPPPAFFVLVTAAVVVVSVLLYPVVRHVLSAPGAPRVVLGFVLIFPLADLFLLAAAIYVATTFAGSRAGHPWAAVAFGVLYLAAADLLSIYYGCHAGAADLLDAASQVLSFMSYAAIAWGAWYQRVVVREALVT